MNKVGSVIRAFFVSACLLNLVSLPGCGDNVARIAPEEVLKAKKEDFGKEQLETGGKAKAAGKTTASPKMP